MQGPWWVGGLPVCLSLLSGVGSCALIHLWGLVGAEHEGSHIHRTQGEAPQHLEAAQASWKLRAGG